MMAVLDNVHDTWLAQAENCSRLDINNRYGRAVSPTQGIPQVSQPHSPSQLVAHPLYLLCSATCLGQYRFPIVNYWRGLVVQLVAYEVQFQVRASKRAPLQRRAVLAFLVSSPSQRRPARVTLQLLVYWESRHDMDNMDYATSNLVGAMAAVVIAFILTYTDRTPQAILRAPLVPRGSADVSVEVLLLHYRMSRLCVRLLAA